MCFEKMVKRDVNLTKNVDANLKRFVLKKNTQIDTRFPKAQKHTDTAATCHSMRRLKRCAMRTRQAGWTWAAC